MVFIKTITNECMEFKFLEYISGVVASLYLRVHYGYKRCKATTIEGSALDLNLLST